MTDAGQPRDAALTHVRPDGAAHMVDVGGKAESKRVAVAEGVVATTPEVVALLATGALPKGEALGVARVAGILGAKKTPELVPLCHPIMLTGVDVDLVATGSEVRIRATVKTTGVTGVEMEALTAVSVAALTVYDMIKGVDRAAVIRDLRVLEKSGGRSGAWVRDV